MARPTEGQLQDLGPWVRGQNNLSEEARLAYESFRASANIDVTDTGGIRRRVGYQRVVSVPGARGLWSNRHRAFYAVAQNLYSFDGQNSVLLHTGLHPHNPLAYCAIEPTVYVTDGASGYAISPVGVVRRWSPPEPARQPVATALSYGGLTAGRYMVAVTHAYAGGTESGTSSSTVVDVPDGGGIQLADFPVPPSDVNFRVYVSNANGTELFFYGAVPPTVLTVDITSRPLGRKLTTMFKSSLPAGQHLGYFQGRLYSASGNLMYWSEPMTYGLTDLSRNYVMLSSPFTMIAGLPEGAGGMFVASEHRTLFLRGNNPAQFEQIEAYPYGVVSGTLTYVAASMLGMEGESHSLPVWMSRNGVFCVGMPNGKVSPVNEATFAAAVGNSGASMFRMQRGVPQVVTSMSGALEANSFAVADTASMTVTRNGIEV